MSSRPNPCPYRAARVDVSAIKVYLSKGRKSASCGPSASGRGVMLAAIVVGLLVSALAAGSIIIVRAWRLGGGGRDRGLPPLIVMPDRATHIEPVIGPAVPRSVSHPAPRSYGPNGHQAPGLVAGTTVILADNRVADDSSETIGSASETVKFRRPGEEPIQILPGRLEVISGESTHREIRFVRSPGEPAELILGRDPGKSPQSVALDSETVSRQHARFAYANGRWAVANLSRTNPVVVNDERLGDGTSERPLVDGDRVELGEVVLRFRSR
jgi:hypothetical protein